MEERLQFCIVRYEHQRDSTVRFPNAPTVNLVHDLICSRFAVLQNEILANPLDKVVFEATLDDLVQKVTGQEFVDIGVREVVRERLHKIRESHHQRGRVHSQSSHRLHRNLPKGSSGQMFVRGAPCARRFASCHPIDLRDACGLSDTL